MYVGIFLRAARMYNPCRKTPSVPQSLVIPPPHMNNTPTPILHKTPHTHALVSSVVADTDTKIRLDNVFYKPCLISGQQSALQHAKKTRFYFNFSQMIPLFSLSPTTVPINISVPPGSCRGFWVVRLNFKGLYHRTVPKT